MSATQTTKSPACQVDQRLERVRHEEFKLSVVKAILDLDPTGREELRTHIEALTEALLSQDTDSVAVITEAIEELFSTDRYECEDGTDIDGWEHDLSSSKGELADAIRRRKAMNRMFIERYNEAKRNRGLSNQRQVAEACGISPTTVRAIESEQVAPQSGTLQKIAHGLGVSVPWLLGSEKTGV